ncbi:MAG: hypothetical protein ABW068_14195 [Candidatus Thiodiazotropha sp.]
MKKLFVIGLSLLMALVVSNLSYAKDSKERDLPPGLQKKAERGERLPPGWQKKLAVGDVLEEDIYEHGKIIATDGKGLVTISIEGKLLTRQ